MDINVDYSSYTLEELYSAAESINSEAYPDRAQEIHKFINEKEAQLQTQPEVAPPSRVGTQASRIDRLFAVVVDGLINILASLPLIFYYGLDVFREPTLQVTLVSFMYGFLIFAVLHGYLLYKNGQTIGKYLLSIRIENVDGTKADWKKIAFLRLLPIMLIHQFSLGFIGPLIAGLINPLLIFGKSQRCLHDYIANTKVSYCAD